MSLHERALCVYVHTTKFLWLRVRIDVFPPLSEKPFSSQYIDLPILKYKSGHLSEAISKVSTDINNSLHFRALCVHVITQSRRINIPRSGLMPGVSWRFKNSSVGRDRTLACKFAIASRYM